MTRTVPAAWLTPDGHLSIPTVVDLATADTSEPCTHGHYDCATVEGGPCSAEAAAYCWSHGIDIDAECWQPRTDA